MEADFIKPEDPRWDNFLRDVKHDFYHLPSYIKLASSVEGGIPCAFWARDEDLEVLIPLLIRSLPEHLGAPADWCDALTPYGYPGPLLKCERRDFPENELERRLAKLLRQFKIFCEERKIVTFFCRLHPLLGFAGSPLMEIGEVVSHGETVYVDLTLPRNILRSKIRRGHKRGVRKLRDEGFSVLVDRFDQLEEFISIYHSSMKRLEASGFYFFPDEYFYELVDLLRDRIHLFSAVTRDDLLVCSVLVTEVCGIMQGHLIGTREGFFDRSLNKLVLYEAIEWGRANGKSVFHIGGGVGAKKDSLFEFKAGFSDRRAVFKTWRVTVNSERYKDLNERYRSACKVEKGRPSFFPFYRL